MALCVDFMTALFLLTSCRLFTLTSSCSHLLAHYSLLTSCSPLLHLLDATHQHSDEHSASDWSPQLLQKTKTLCSVPLPISEPKHRYSHFFSLIKPKHSVRSIRFEAFRQQLFRLNHSHCEFHSSAAFRNALVWLNWMQWPETAFPMNKPIHLIIHQANCDASGESERNTRPNRRLRFFVKR